MEPATREQLETYVARNSFVENAAPLRRLVILSECSRDYAECTLEAHEIGGVPIQHGSWKEVAALASGAQPRESNAEKRLIEELLIYLGGTHHRAETRLAPPH